MTAELEDENTPPPPPTKKVTSKTIINPPQVVHPKNHNTSKKKATDYDRELEKIDKKSASEKKKIERLKDLEDKISSAKKYSFGWFKLLLELELLIGNENKNNNKTISISFGRVEEDPGTQRTLILKYPNRYIPQFMEDLENIPLVLHTVKTDIKVEIEVSGIRHNTLSVKLKKAYESIYRSRRLNSRSSYHIHSAIFTFEYVKYLSERLAENNRDEKFSIRIVLSSGMIIKR